MFNSFVIYAADAAPQAAAKGAGSFSLLPTLLIYGVFLVLLYFLMIAPQKKKANQHKSMLAELKEGDTVITSSGIKGEIIGVTDEFFEVRIDKGVKITIKKNYIQGIYK